MAVRPGRDNIAAPDLPDSLVWLGHPPESMPALTAGGPVIVHFIEFAQLNSVRTLPYLGEWWQRYREMGLSVIGVQAPRFPFGADPEAVRAGVAALGIEFPVAIDAEHDLWHAYGCQGWPSLFLWSLGGALSWAHFGEGEYAATEEAIQDELREIDALRELPAPMAPVRATDAPGIEVIAPTPEIFPGGSWEQPWTASEEDPALGPRLPGGRRLRHGRGRGRDRRRDRRRVARADRRRPRSRSAGDRRAPPPRGPQPRPPPLPRPADLVGQLRRGRAVGGEGVSGRRGSGQTGCARRRRPDGTPS